LKAELALISLNPAFYGKWETTSVFGKWKQPKFVAKWMTTFKGKWKTTSIFRKVEDNPNLKKMEDDLHFMENGRRPKFFDEWKTTFFNVRQPQWKTT
jgi:hypothetical protein